MSGGVLGLVLPGGAGLVSDSGWLAEGLAPKDNPALTSSVPTVTTSMDVVFFLGGAVVELIALPASWRRSPGENLRSGGARSDDGGVLDTTSFLEASSWRPRRWILMMCTVAGGSCVCVGAGGFLFSFFSFCTSPFAVLSSFGGVLVTPLLINEFGSPPANIQKKKNPSFPKKTT